jgi:hypothetical protein
MPPECVLVWLSTSNRAAFNFKESKQSFDCFRAHNEEKTGTNRHPGVNMLFLFLRARYSTCLVGLFHAFMFMLIICLSGFRCYHIIMLFSCLLVCLFVCLFVCLSVCRFVFFAWLSRRKTVGYVNWPLRSLVTVPPREPRLHAHQSDMQMFLNNEKIRV